MQDLKFRENKIKEKRKNTPWKKFIKEIASYYGIVLHKNNGFVSKYPKSDRIGKILKTIEYEDIRENFTKYGVDYDFSKNIFENIRLLKQKTDFPNLSTYGGAENCDFADTTHNTKNAYLTFGATWDNENILYSSCIKGKCVDVFNSVMVQDCSENIYFCNGIIKGYKIFYSKFIMNSNNIWFSRNLNGCSECIFCDSLDNKKYCIKNKQLDEKIYFEEKEKILKNKNSFLDIYNKIPSDGKNFGSTDVEGNFIINSQNVSNGHLVYQVKNGNNLVIVGSEVGNENMFDIFTGGSSNSSDMYGCCMTGTTQNIYIGESIGMSSNIYYSFNIQDCSFCHGCIGLKNKSFCILNKQYTKEEWYELTDKIFAQMERDGILGEFFPGSLNPLYFNDTMAYLIDDSFTKEEVEKDGYMWREENIKVDIPEGVDVIKVEKLDKYQGYDENGKWQIDKEVLKKVIKDKKGNIYKIVPIEYDFLIKHSLPLPEIHWLDRIKLGFKFK
ncbi:MAG: hypothetical protein WC850_01485 [Candidatus Gracilibacteria bacterium]